jgi:hypothetical protein
MTLPRPSPTFPYRELPSAASMLVAAAARVDARCVTYGPLWGVRCSTKDRPKTELQVYDVFCMIFLDRPGAYYRVDQAARTTRGHVTPALLIAQLQTYHRLLVDAQSDRANPFLTNLEAKDWWLMPERVRRSLPFPSSYDFSYPAFLRKFLPQHRCKDVEFRFFNSLAHYLPLLLSPDVELRRCPSLSSSAFAYGVFARRRLEKGEYRRPVPALRGQLVAITEKEFKALESGGAAFSVLEIDGEGISRLQVPGTVGRKRLRVKKGGGAFVVAGGMAFLNHACEEHANMYPAVWGDEEDVGKGQWQVATAKWTVRAGKELFIFYAQGEGRSGVYPCSECPQS